MIRCHRRCKAGGQFPLFQRIIFGSISDVAIIVTTAETINGPGLKSYSFSLDRGFFSSDYAHYYAGGSSCQNSEPKSRIRIFFSSFFLSFLIFSVLSQLPAAELPLPRHFDVVFVDPAYFLSAFGTAAQSDSFVIGQWVRTQDFRELKRRKRKSRKT